VSDSLSTTGSEDNLLSPDLLARLERLSIGTRRRLRGNVLGGRRSVRHGASVEFTDYRDYLPGDDLRYVDWKAYARLSKLLVRLFTEEDDLTLHLMLDASASMRFGEHISKLRFAQRLCAALGVIALSSFDRCTFTALPWGQARNSVVLRGGSSVSTLLKSLKRVQASGSAKLTTGLMRYAAGKVSPGVVVIVSDFYEHALTPGLLTRLARRHNVVLAHIADPTEVDPSTTLGADGDEVRLIDSETGSFIELTLTPSVLEDYKRQFDEFCSGIEALAKASGATYLRISTDTPIEDVVLGSLRQKRVVG
jgi:uncharacterized protein (DUF58 family)